jgi:parallel beta-helix repeat protein
VVRNNNSHHNNGPGLWSDYVGDNTLYEGNVARNNAGPGIFHEISGSAVIRGNTVEGNGDGPSYKSWVDGAGILVNSSVNTQIVGNDVRNNNDGIGLVESGRANGLRNITVRDNTVSLRSGALNGAVATSDSAALNMPSWNIVFDGNRYSGGGGNNFAWGGSYITWDQWRAAGQDPSGNIS